MVLDCRDFAYTVAEQLLIEEARKELKPWEADCISSLKRRIFDYHSDRQKKMCCYCQRDQHGEFKMVVDIEHVLPKNKYHTHMFSIWNLSVSCKRCNMQIKKERTDFLVKPEFTDYCETDRHAYYFLHPNLDEAHAQLTRISVQVGRQRLVKYVVAPNSVKGSYTYKFFRLNELEIESFDAAQSKKAGIPGSETLDIFRTMVQLAGG